MLGGADTKKQKLLKMLDRAGLGKASSTQYLRSGLHEKALFTENAWRDGIKKACLIQNVRWDWLC